MNNSDCPAMPFTQKPEYQHQEAGLTKREYFAGLAMQGILANDNVADGEGNLKASEVAKFTLLLADALLKELGK